MSKDDPIARPGIYQIRNTINGKVYIGSAVNVRKRWAYHRQDLTRGNHPNRHLQAAWDQYGPGAFAWEILRFVSKKENLLRIEQVYLDRFRPYDREIGYNNDRIAGSSLGLKRSPESRAKMSAARKGRKPSPETIAKIVATKTGVSLSEETRAKISAAQAGRKKSRESVAKMAASLRGKPRSPEAIAKTVEAHRGRKNSPETLAKMAEARRKAMADPEARARVSAANKGRKRTPEQRARMVAAQQRIRERKGAAGRPVHQMTFGFEAENAQDHHRGHTR